METRTTEGTEVLGYAARLYTEGEMLQTDLGDEEDFVRLQPLGGDLTNLVDRFDCRLLQLERSTAAADPLSEQEDKEYRCDRSPDFPSGVDKRKVFNEMVVRGLFEYDAEDFSTDRALWKLYCMRYEDLTVVSSFQKYLLNESTSSRLRRELEREEESKPQRSRFTAVPPPSAPPQLEEEPPPSSEPPEDVSRKRPFEKSSFSQWGVDTTGRFIPPGVNVQEFIAKKFVGDECGVEFPSCLKEHLIMEQVAHFVKRRGEQALFRLRLQEDTAQRLPFLADGHKLHPYFRFLLDSGYILTDNLSEQELRVWIPKEVRRRVTLKGGSRYLTLLDEFIESEKSKQKAPKLALQTEHESALANVSTANGQPSEESGASAEASAGSGLMDLLGSYHDAEEECIPFASIPQVCWKAPIAELQLDPHHAQVTQEIAYDLCQRKVSGKIITRLDAIVESGNLSAKYAFCCISTLAHRYFKYLLSCLTAHAVHSSTDDLEAKYEYQPETKKFLKNVVEPLLETERRATMTALFGSADDSGDDSD